MRINQLASQCPHSDEISSRHNSNSNSTLVSLFISHLNSIFTSLDSQVKLMLDKNILWLLRQDEIAWNLLGKCYLLTGIQRDRERESVELLQAISFTVNNRHNRHSPASQNALRRLGHDWHWHDSDSDMSQGTVSARRWQSFQQQTLAMMPWNCQHLTHCSSEQQLALYTGSAASA